MLYLLVIIPFERLGDKEDGLSRAQWEPSEGEEDLELFVGVYEAGSSSGEWTHGTWGCVAACFWLLEGRETAGSCGGGSRRLARTILAEGSKCRRSQVLKRGVRLLELFDAQSWM